MKKTIPLFALLILTSQLSACANVPFLYRPNVQQGNLITQDMLNQIKLGMSTEQVRYVMGTPILINTFDDNTYNYVYTFQSGKKPMQLKRIILQFSQSRLAHITSSP